MILETKHQEFRERIRQFAQDEIAPRAKDIDRQSEYPADIVKKMGEAGFLGIFVPPEYGGLGLDCLSYTMAVEEVGRICGSTGIFLAAHCSLAVAPMEFAGNEEQKQRWLIPLARGEKIGAFGLTEPNAGSDASATQTTAIAEGDQYVVNGTKCFITSGHVADVVIITATKDPSLGYAGISAYVVEKGTPGFAPGKKEDKLGLRGSITSELIFDDCRIPKEYLIGKEGDGFKVFMKTLDGGRISIGALALGIAQAALDASVQFVKTTTYAGRPCYKHQAIQSLIAEMGTEVEAARLLVYQAAMLKDAGVPFTKEAAMAKFYASKIGMQAAQTAIDIHGMSGITGKYHVERFMRDVKLMEIGEGTSEIQKIVIAREFLGRR